MQFWNEILNTALLGTEKKPVMTAGLPAPLQEAAALINDQQATDVAEQFLQIAAVGLNFRQSGTKPLHQPGLVAPEAPAETLPYCSAPAAQVLKDILSEDSPPLVALWLERCVAAEQLVFPELVPILLNRGVNHKGIQQAVATVCGRRGEWLSRFNPAWEFSTVVDDDQLWQTGQPEQRKMLLKRMRQQDPAKTREWLLQSWPQENTNTQVELLKQLDGSVQPEDEPFLVGQLKEKSQKVKDEALRLLKQLPGSAVVRKYEELVRPLLFVKKEKALLGMMTKTVLQIRLPVLPEKGEYAPGIDKLSSDKSFKDEEFVLYQLIQNTPPAGWVEHLMLPPDGILGLFAGANEKYVDAFAKAALQFRDATWAQVSLEKGNIFYGDLVSLLPPAEKEDWFIRNFTKMNTNLIVQQAQMLEHEWSYPLAKEIIGHTAKQPYQYNISFYKQNIARIPTAVAGMLSTVIPTEAAQIPLWVRMADQVGLLLRLKEQTLKAFNE